MSKQLIGLLPTLHQVAKKYEKLERENELLRIALYRVLMVNGGAYLHGELDKPTLESISRCEVYFGDNPDTVVMYDHEKSENVIDASRIGAETEQNRNVVGVLIAVDDGEGGTDTLFAKYHIASPKPDNIIYQCEIATLSDLQNGELVIKNGKIYQWVGMELEEAKEATIADYYNLRVLL